MNSISKKSLLPFLALGIGLVSCQDYDAGFTTSEISQSKLEASYAKNFIAEYGDLSEVKSWDLSRLGSSLNNYNSLTRAGHVVDPADIEAYVDTRSTSSFRDDAPGGYTYSFVPLEGTTAATDAEIAAIRTNTTVGQMSVGGNTIPAGGDYYYVPKGLLQWYHEKFTNYDEHTYEYSKNGYGEENQPNKYKPQVGSGTHISIPKPTHDFWIVPVFQDVVWTCWNLHMVCNGKDYKIWDKGQDLEFMPGTFTLTYHLQIKSNARNTDGTDKYSVDNNVTYKHDLTRKVQGTAKLYDFVWQPELKSKDQNTETGKWRYIYYIDDAQTKQGFFTSDTDISFTQDGKDYISITLPKAGKSINSNRITTDSINETHITNEASLLTDYYKLDVDGRPLKSNWNTRTDGYFFSERTRSKPIKINASAITTDITFYLEITHGEWKKEDGVIKGACFPGTKQCSDEGMMSFFPYTGGAYDFKAVTGSDNSSAMFLGVEDGNITSDYDYNDAAFLLLGLDEITETTKRRYLCEDLGSTYDFDFNDIVVDATQVITYDVTNSNMYTSRTPKSVKQDFSIARMCGTLPFQVMFGNSTFGKKMNPDAKDGKTTGYTPAATDTNYKLSWTSPEGSPITVGEKLVVTGAPWNPATHNILINVWQNAKSLDEAIGDASNDNVVIHTVSFGDYDPKTGNTKGNKIPQIIAVDPSVNWMEESIHIPQAWIDAAKTIDIK